MEGLTPWGAGARDGIRVGIGGHLLVGRPLLGVPESKLGRTILGAAGEAAEHPPSPTALASILSRPGSWRHGTSAHGTGPSRSRRPPAARTSYPGRRRLGRTLSHVLFVASVSSSRCASAAPKSVFHIPPFDMMRVLIPTLRRERCECRSCRNIEITVSLSNGEFPAHTLGRGQIRHVTSIMYDCSHNG